MPSFSTSKILAITGATIVGAISAYAIYFDYQRRNSPEFRKTLKRKLKKHQELEKLAQAQAKEAKLAQVGEFLTVELAKDPIPQDQSKRESAFAANVEIGEKLAMTSGKEMEAALKFYKALSLYPNPADLLGIYQRSVPEPVYEYIVLMIAILPPSNVSSFLSGNLGGSTVSGSGNADVPLTIPDIE